MKKFILTLTMLLTFGAGLAQLAAGPGEGDYDCSKGCLYYYDQCRAGGGGANHCFNWVYLDCNSVCFGV